MSNIEITLFLLPGLIVGLTFHEFAHAWSASLLGDDFPRRKGRVSLNPMKHLSPLGTLALFIIHFGWGKPVEINLYNFRHPKRDYLISSLAGPAANLVLAGILLATMFFFRKTYIFGPAGEGFMSMAYLFVWFAIVINVILAVLNLLPIPPLDGSKIWPCLIPGMKAGFSPKTSILFVFVLLALIYTNTLNPVFSKTVNAVHSILPTPDYSKVNSLVEKAQEQSRGEHHEQACELLRQAIAINPDDADCWYELAYNLDCLDETDQAFTASTKALELEPDCVETNTLHANLLEYLGRPEEAQKYRTIAESLEKAKNPGTK